MGAVMGAVMGAGITANGRVLHVAFMNLGIGRSVVQISEMVPEAHGYPVQKDVNLKSHARPEECRLCTSSKGERVPFSLANPKM